MDTGAISSSVDSASVPLSLGCGNYLSMQTQASYCSASSSPSARRPSSCSDVDNEESNVSVIVNAADGHADVCASAV